MIRILLYSILTLFAMKCSSASFKNNIELKNVSYKYKNQKINILENINLTIKKGSKVGIIGETGSGKSTFLNILMSLIKPSSKNI